MRSLTSSKVLPVVVLAAAILFLGYGPDRSQSVPLLVGYAVAFSAYAWSMFRASFSWKVLLLVAVGLRLMLFLAPITWTDDHFRYIWDGLCSVNGISPFAFTPEELLRDRPDVFAQALFDRLNSPGFHSVYPPASQAVFAFSAWLGRGDAWASTLALRAIIIAMDVAAVFALGALLRNDPNRTAKVALYALNPLVLMELTVNLHTEALLIAPMLWAICLIKRQRFDLAALLLAVMAAIKLWPILFLAWVPSRLSIRRSIRFLAITIVVFTLAWVPFRTNGLIPHLASGVKLFASFLEFNGGLFEALRHFLGDDLVKGTWLLGAITVLALVIFIALQWIRRTMDLPEAMLWILAIHLFGSQVVHPWYIVPLIALAVLTGYRWPIAWSLLIMPTYLTYGSSPHAQPYWWIAIEYGLLLAFIAWELRNAPQRCKVDLGPAT